MHDWASRFETIALTHGVPESSPCAHIVCVMACDAWWFKLFGVLASQCPCGNEMRWDAWGLKQWLGQREETGLRRRGTHTYTQGTHRAHRQKGTPASSPTVWFQYVCADSRAMKDMISLVCIYIVCDGYKHNSMSMRVNWSYVHCTACPAVTVLGVKFKLMH